MRASKRVLAALASGALLVPLNPFATPAFAVGEADPPPPQAIEQFCAEVPSEPEQFTDNDDPVHERAIECLAFLEITKGGPQGLPNNKFGGEFDVLRSQMALFIARAIDAANELDCRRVDQTAELPPYDGSNAFTDVPNDGSERTAAINRLEQVGIVRGGPEGLPPTQYGPGLDVRRDQMASFLNRAADFIKTGQANDANGGGFGPTTADYYTDDEGAIPHEPNINAITSVGIATGFTKDIYGPRESVKRKQMASFIIRTLAQLNEEGRICRVGEEDEQPEPEPEPGDGPTIEDARVATDAGMATDSNAATDGAIATDGSQATGTATSGDVFLLDFNEPIASDSVDNAQITVTDGDGSRAVIVCGDDADVDAGDGTTTAECELDDDRTLLEIRLLEDAENVGDDGDEDLDFPLEIEGISGLADDEGDSVDLGDSDDTTIDRDDGDETNERNDPDPGPDTA